MIKLNSIFPEQLNEKHALLWKRYDEQLNELGATYMKIQQDSTEELEKTLTDYLVMDAGVRIKSAHNSYKYFNVIMGEGEKAFEIVLDKSDYMLDEFDQVNFEFFHSGFDDFMMQKLNVVTKMTEIVKHDTYNNLLYLVNDRVRRTRVCLDALRDKMDSLRSLRDSIKDDYMNQLSEQRMHRFFHRGWTNCDEDNEFFDIVPDKHDISFKNRYNSLGWFKSIELVWQKNMDTRKTHTVKCIYNDGHEVTYENVKLQVLCNAFWNLWSDTEKDVKEALDQLAGINQEKTELV